MNRQASIVQSHANALGALAMSAIQRAKKRLQFREACRNRRPWTEEEVELLRMRYADEPTETIAAELGRSVANVYGKAKRLGLSKSEAFLASALAGRLNGSQGVTHRFSKGHMPWNKGKKGLPSAGRMAETQFRKGSKPGNWLPIGSYRTNQDGYLQRKVSDTGYPPRDWVSVHVLLWEEHNGPVPPGHCLCFKDGNKQYIELENLELITRAERMRRNTIHRYPPELRDAIRAVGRLKHTIRRVEREKQN
ncbi:HNH endonuclease signature motif containing protein [Pseudomonas lopnurensis]|uniref:HNH endonuclease signature motif containing protein n=1 Tax=Pseudomonas lopnurensis TaxID=1477517 RepID=UPI0028A62456|nr:HNH endonuclease signature motif containing protein [Pseudomonas lopnurensis]